MIVFGYAIGYVVIARIVVLKKLKNREEGRESIKKEDSGWEDIDVRLNEVSKVQSSFSMCCGSSDATFWLHLLLLPHKCC